MNETGPRVNGETYFFRDDGQFELLRRRLLPELIERRRAARTLRLWSAGCASGEEAYSIAMLVDMLLPERDGWDVLILGNDIDPAALAKARRGRYGPWSFRMAPAMLQQRYFHRKGDEWTLDERIRGMVSFRAIDLVGEPFPAGELRDMDLILCRNVFIYFSADAVSAVADKLAATLKDDGYLMTGHTELIGHRPRNVQSRLFAEGVVYQRAAQAPYAPPPRPSPAGGEGDKRSRPDLRPQEGNGARRAPSADDLLATARDLADRGDFDGAGRICRLAQTADPLAAGPYFLLAQLAQLKAAFGQAAELLEKALYLDPACVAATLELAALCERAGNSPRAKSLRRAARDIVRALPGDHVIEPYETTAAEMAQWLAP